MSVLMKTLVHLDASCYFQRERDSQRSKDSKQQIFRRASNFIIFAEIHKRADTHARTLTHTHNWVRLLLHCIYYILNSVYFM